VIWADDVLDEHHGVPDKEVGGHHRWRGQPHKVFARGVVQRLGLFQDQDRIKKEKFNLLYIYMCVNLHSAQCTEFASSVAATAATVPLFRFVFFVLLFY
jgi:hypothetical protein